MLRLHRIKVSQALVCACSQAEHQEWLQAMLHHHGYEYFQVINEPGFVSIYPLHEIAYIAARQAAYIRPERFH